MTPGAPTLLAFLVGFTVVFAVTASLVASGQEDGDDDRDEDDQLEREVRVESDDEGVEIELKREEGDAEDKVDVSFDFENAEFELKHEAEASDNETENKLEVAFERLAEYQDENGNGRFDVGERLVSAWRMDDDDDEDDDDDRDDDERPEVPGRVQWRGAIVQDIEQGGASGKKITATAGLGDNGTFELRMYVFGDFVTLNGTSLEPTSVKFDIVIEDYPFAENDTALVLLVETKAKREVEAGDDEERDDDEEAVAASGAGDLRLVFSWKTNATVDGTDTTVGSTLMALKEETEDGETKQEREIALSYARGASIIHDPELKVLTADAGRDAESIPGPAPGVLAVALMVVAAASRHRQR